MFLHKYLILATFSLTFVTVKTQDDDIISNLLDAGVTPIQNLRADLLLMEDKILALHDKVDIKLYYECLCSDCKIFDTTQLKPTVEKLASNLNLKVYPYGNAETIDNGNSSYEFKCQHGPEECYGNKLHACAIDYLGNETKAVFFNSCLMDPTRKNRGSDDEAVEECARTFNIHSGPIKQCAKGPKGTMLLKYYGDESKKVGFNYVPYTMINGVPNDGSNFLRDVCAAFVKQPPACAQVK